MPHSRVGRVSAAATIDVLIPAIEKDLGTLPYVIDALRAKVLHPIGQIIIIAPKRQKMIDFCRAKGCRFVDENAVLPLTKKDISYGSAKWERSGWLFQQLLKLSGDRVCSADYFLVIDADTVLIAPHSFRSGGKSVFYCRNWSQPEYFATYRRLMGRKPASSSSFVTHYMLFEKAKLARMKKDIEARHRMPWYKAVIQSMNRKKQFAFSEYETYGNYVYSTDRSGILLRNARNKSMHGSPGDLGKPRIAKLARTYRSLSFHKRKGYVRIAGSNHSR
ncbi:DUF6492 family protein [Paenibacillus sp. M1]|uniref:DUF6492 family protein n=1 Tax=Paenibacillus haidiansis TaxID=1574488 RepID=A0ABU7VWJ8_9BACL